MIRIRLATEKDRAAIAALQAASWSDAYRDNLPESYLDQQLADDLARHWSQQEIWPGDVVMVAESASQAIGFIAVWCRPDAFIDNFHVLPDFRSTGIGSNLFGVAATSLMVRGHQQASLWVFESNAAAIRFYRRCGAEVVDRQQKSFFGQSVNSLQLHWRDIGTILEALAMERKVQHG